METIEEEIAVSGSFGCVDVWLIFEIEDCNQEIGGCARTAQEQVIAALITHD